MGKYREFTLEFKREAVAKMKTCGDVAALARELTIPRQVLYKWRDRLAGRKTPPPAKGSPAALRAEVGRLKAALADKTLEVDFFKRALQKIEGRRRQSADSGEKASTSKCESGCRCKAS